MTDEEFLLWRRRHVAVERDGTWLCRCGVALGDSEFRCEPCAAKVSADEERQEAARRRQERIETAKEAAWRWCEHAPNWPHADVNAAGFSVVHPRLQELARKFDGSSSALILGPSRVGKTTCALAWLRDRSHRAIEAESQRTERGRSPELSLVVSALWTTGLRLAKARRHRAFEESDLIRDALSASFLVIDELGPERPSDAIADVVFERYDAKRPTLVTSGLTSAEFKDRTGYGSGLFARLTDKGIGRLVEVVAGG